MFIVRKMFIVGSLLACTGGGMLGFVGVNDGIVGAILILAGVLLMSASEICNSIISRR